MNEEELLEARVESSKARLRARVDLLCGDLRATTDVPSAIRRHPVRSLVLGATAGFVFARGMAQREDGRERGALLATFLRSGLDAGRLLLLRTMLD